MMATALDPALNPDVFGMQPRLPTAKPKVSTPMGAAEERLAGTEEKLGGALKEQAEFTGQQALQKQKQEAAKAKGEAEILGKQAEELRAAEEPIRLAEDEKMKARFAPTRETAMEMAGLYSLINVIGFAIGRGGKQSSMQALSAMNGMLEGYRQGSTDRFNQEKKLFDANLKQLTDNVNTLTNRLQRVVQLSTVDKLKAQQELTVALAESGADFIKENINKFGLPATIQYLKQVQTAAQRAVEKERDFERKAEQKARDAAEARQRELDRQASQRSLQQERLVAQRDLQAERVASSLKRAQSKASSSGEKVPPKEIQSLNTSRNILIPALEQALPVLDRLNKTGEWATMTTLLGIPRVGTRLAEAAFENDKEAIKLIRTFSKFRAGEFETAGKALTKTENDILAPLFQADFRTYQGIKNAVSEGLSTLKKEQKSMEAGYPWIKSFNQSYRADLSGEETAQTGPYSDAEKEKRYQEWKASRGAQQ